MQNTQQKFGERNTYIPRDTSQVSGSMAMSFNREETLGERSLKTSSNNLDVNLHQRIDGLKAKVVVLNKENIPQFLHPFKKVVSLRVGVVGENL